MDCTVALVTVNTKWLKNKTKKHVYIFKSPGGVYNRLYLALTIQLKQLVHDPTDILVLPLLESQVTKLETRYCLVLII